MGIRGLAGWVSWAASETIRSPDWSEYRGKRVGFDVLGFLYKAKSRRIDPFTYLANFIACAKGLGIELMPVFDGKPPEEKRDALMERSRRRETASHTSIQLTSDLNTVPMNTVQRTEVLEIVKRLSQTATYLTSLERDTAKQLFYACGIVSYNATEEADDVLAYFSKREEIYAVISNDYDLLTRGVERLLVPDFYAQPGDAAGWKSYNLSEILRSVQFSYTQFVEMCVLMGSDYTSGCKSLPYKSAYWAIKYRGGLDKTLKVIGVSDTVKYIRAIEKLMGTDLSATELMGEKQWEKFRSGPHLVEPESLTEMSDTILSEITPECLLALQKV